MLSGIGPEAQLRDGWCRRRARPARGGFESAGSPVDRRHLPGSARRPRGRHNHGEVMGVLRTAADAGAPDLQILFVDSAAVIGLDVPDTYLIGVCACSRTAAAPSGSPGVTPSWRRSSTRTISATIATCNDGRGFRIAREIGSAPALEAWRAEEIAPGPVGRRRGVAARASFARPRRRTTTRWEHARSVRRRNPWSTVSFGCTASAVCGWWMRRSCRRCRPTTRWPPCTPSPNGARS